MSNPAIMKGRTWRRLTGLFLAIVLFSSAMTPASAEKLTSPTEGPPDFSKTFIPDHIGPGSTTTLRFDIDNTQNPDPVVDLAFSDTLPNNVFIATPANASTDCNTFPAPTLTAPDGGETISLSGGGVGAFSNCSVWVNITSSEITFEGGHYNETGDLTSSAGNSGTATAELFVDSDLPGFSKSFSPSTVPFGGRSTLTFTIDNDNNGEDVVTLSFSDNLPPGMVVAGPANASTDCGNPILPAALIAVPGTSFISLSSIGTAGFPALDSEDSCTVDVDVIGGALGSLSNISNDLVVREGFDDVWIGKASAVLEVTGGIDDLFITKSFTDDPAPPGGTVELEFTITNGNHDEAVTDISFNDDLKATLTGLTPTLPPTPDPPCGDGSTLTFDEVGLTLTGGILPPVGSCTFSVTLSVPEDAAQGVYPNTTDVISGLIGEAPITGNAASDSLYVVSFPILTKEFTEDPVGAGDDVTLEFTITNPEDGSPMSSIAFLDELTTFLPEDFVVSLPDTPCGVGSSLDLFDTGLGQGFELTGGDLAAAGAPGDSCTFSVTITIPPGFAAGAYLNTTGPIAADLDFFESSVIGPPASDILNIVGAPSLLKEFTDDPVDPGDSVTLEFTLTHDALAPGDAEEVSFTDDLAALAPAIPGLAATGLPLSDLCGPGNGVLTGSAGDTLLTFYGGTLVPGQVCTFSVTLDVPAEATPGNHTNTTSDVTATVEGVTATGNPAEDDLMISTLTLTKEFIDDPVIAGDTTTLRFTLTNASDIDATGIIFYDNLGASQGALTGLAAVPPLPISPCGAASFTGTTNLSFLAGSVAAGSSCSFDVTVLVPPGTADGVYINTTSGVSSNLGAGAPAIDGLEVNSKLLTFNKSFTDDPVLPGDDVTLEFSITNDDLTETISGIEFDDNLDAVIPGLAAVGLPASDVCGAGSAISGTSLLSLTGGYLGPEETCTFSVTLTVPPGAVFGSYNNTTTPLIGWVGDLCASGAATSPDCLAALLQVYGDAARDDLEVYEINFSKSFNAHTIANGHPVLSFTIENLSTSATSGFFGFTDDLEDVLPGLVATGLPQSNVCGASSQISGDSLLTFVGGELGPEASCTFSVTLHVPGSALPGSYLNKTSDLTSSGLILSPAASAILDVFYSIYIPFAICDGDYPECYGDVKVE